MLATIKSLDTTKAVKKSTEAKLKLVSPTSDSSIKNRIYLQDVLIGLKALQDKSVDVIIADPPYNIGKDFGECKDKMPMDEYVSWCLKWMTEALRVLKDSGTFYIYGFSEILAHLFVAADAKHKRWLVWHYTNKNAASLKNWQRSHESIICLSKSTPVFNVDLVREPYTETFLKNAAGKKRAGTESRFNKNGKETVYSAHPQGALPRDVLKNPALAGGAGANERAHWCVDCQSLIFGKNKREHSEHILITHPTQKPIALTRRLIAASKNRDGATDALVLFSGSGAECVAARMEGCSVVGFDLSPEYVHMGNSWLNLIATQKNNGKVV